MKKYVKPVLIYERYELSRNIAAGCAWDVNYANENVCMADPDPNILGTGWGGSLLTSGQGCYYKVDDGYEDYCYHNGGEFSKIFQS